MRVLIFGSTGLIGNSLYKYLSKNKDLRVYGTTRRNLNYESDNLIYFDCSLNARMKNLAFIINKLRPDLVINCIGITKHIKKNDKAELIDLNSNFPHELAKVSNDLNIKLLQISTDCVFSGKAGNYDELAACDSEEIYGSTKCEGEVLDNFNLTIRISTIGREIDSKNGLLEWFLDQKKTCYGYKKAFFSGITTYELSKVIIDSIIPNSDRLCGLYHITGEKINKFELLNKFSKILHTDIKIIPSIDLHIDRSLNSLKFQNITGYSIKSWDEMLSEEFI
jgi:dTDP-4-dehydrorhamnose reductase